MSAAIDGGNLAQLRSFEVVVGAASSAQTAVARGAYTLQSDVDCYAFFGITGMGAAVALGATQPAFGAATTATLRLYASQKEIWDVLDDVTFIRVIGKTASAGLLTVTGPIHRGGNK